MGGIAKRGWIDRAFGWLKSGDAQNGAASSHVPITEQPGVQPKVAPPASENILRGPFTCVAGYQWRCYTAQGLPARTDSNTFPRQSPLQLFEDGVLLGPAHCIHAEIELEGQGRYSFWEGAINFASSDNSDPNTNGRVYSVRVGPPIFNAMTFGSCHLTFAIQTLEKSGEGNRVFTGPSQSHYTREAIQHLRLYRGELDMPEPLRRLSLKPEDDSLIDTHFNDVADATFLEVCTPFQVRYRDWWLNRNLMGERIVGPIAKLSEDALYAVTHWFYNGLLKPNEAIRAESAQKLVDFLPRDDDFEWLRDVVLEAHVVRQDKGALAADISEFRDMLSTPLVLVTHTLRYMPDGRPISWPAGFHGEVNAVARDLGLAVVNPHEMVAERGAEFALTSDDNPHYTPEFNAVLGERMLGEGRKAKAKG